MQASIQERAQGKDIKPDIPYLEADHHDATYNKAITDFNKALTNFAESNKKSMPLIKEAVGDDLAQKFENAINKTVSSIKKSVVEAKMDRTQSNDYGNIKNIAMEGLKTTQGKISYLAKNIELATPGQDIKTHSKNTLNSISAELEAYANCLHSPEKSNGKGRAL